MFGQDRLEENDRAVGTTLHIIYWIIALIVVVIPLIHRH